MTEFYRDESCGKCTPCREGTYWLVQLLERLEEGHGKESDIPLLADICDNIAGKSSARWAMPRRCPSPAASSCSTTNTFIMLRRMAAWLGRGRVALPAVARCAGVRQAGVRRA